MNPVERRNVIANRTATGGAAKVDTLRGAQIAYSQKILATIQLKQKQGENKELNRRQSQTQKETYIITNKIETHTTL